MRNIFQEKVVFSKGKWPLLLALSIISLIFVTNSHGTDLADSKASNFNPTEVLVGDSVSQAWFELGEDFDEMAYLNALSSAGVRHLMIWSFIATGDSMKDSRIGVCKKREWPWVELSGNCSPPFSFLFFDSSGEPQFNEKYFERLKALMLGARQHNIKLQITLHDGWPKTRFSGHPFNESNGGFLRDKKEYVLGDYLDKTAEVQTAFSSYSPEDIERFRKHQKVSNAFIEKVVALTNVGDEVIWDVFNEGEWYNSDYRQRFIEDAVSLLYSLGQRSIVVPIDVYLKSNKIKKLVSAVSDHEPRWDDRWTLESLARSFRKQAIDIPTYMNEPVPEFNGPGRSRLLLFMWVNLLSGRSFWLSNDTMWYYPERAGLSPMIQELGRATDMLDRLKVDSLGALKSEISKTGILCLRNGSGNAVCAFKANPNSHEDVKLLGALRGASTCRLWEIKDSLQAREEVTCESLKSASTFKSIAEPVILELIREKK